MSFIGDAGGFGVDDMGVTWQAELLAGYRFHFSHFDFNVSVGYKALGFDLSDAHQSTDLTLHGPVLRFGLEL